VYIIGRGDIHKKLKLEKMIKKERK